MAQTQAADPLATTDQAPLECLLCLGKTHFHPTDAKLIFGILLFIN